MKVLFSIPGKSLRIVDKDRMIFEEYDGKYYDKNGNIVPKEDGFNAPPFYNLDCEDEWTEFYRKNEGLTEALIPESTVEPEYTVDDVFGMFGFKNKDGKFVIEPQYAYADEFTCGLAAVNLNRTWYRTENGRRFYENHFGFINERGETVIPFKYDEASSFNKYGTAVVSDRHNTYLIDTKGNIIPGTENLNISKYYDYESRYMEFVYFGEKLVDEAPVGIYDTKERKIVLEPSIESFNEWSEDLILVYPLDNEDEDPGQYYINSRGEKLFPWLLDKGFDIVERPNEHLVNIVAVAEYIELPGNPRSYCIHKGKKCDRVFRYGIYSSKERIILPMEYERILEIGDNLFFCLKNGIISVIQVEDDDC